MKKLNFLYFLILPFVFSSCDFLKKFDHFTAGNTFEQSFTIDVAPGISDSFSESTTFSVEDDATISDNLDGIESFSVNDISYKITDFSGDASAVAQGDITVSFEGNTIGDPISISGLNFAELYASGDETNLLLTDKTLIDIKVAYLQSDSNTPLTITASGSYLVDKKTTVEFTIYMSIEALITMKK